ncbi:MAG: hypothetical protein R6X02_20230 [Enhygromyxa sp.]
MQLEIGANHDGQTLWVRYSLTNDTSADVFVQHLDGGGDPITRPYIYHVRPRQVVLWLGTPPPIIGTGHGPLVSFAQPPIPWAQRLSPGESLDELLRLPLPLVELGLWISGEGPLESVWADVIRVRLDVQPKRRRLTIEEHQGSYWIHGPDPLVLEASTTLDPPIAVRRYAEGFHRAGLED